MRKISQPELASVLRLDGPRRVRRFLNIVVDDEVAWGLNKEGWAVMRDQEGRQLFPLWPAPPYATSCATHDWAGYEPWPIELERILNELVPNLGEQGVSFALFPTPAGKGVVVSPDDLRHLLEQELLKYE